jgi:outer membrane protein assembly factor BamB
MALLVATVVLLLGAAAGSTLGLPGSDWAGYLFNGEHTSASPSATLTPAQAQTLQRQWRFQADAPDRHGQPPARFFASPTVYGSSVFIGSDTGWLYALNSKTGTVRWKRMLGYQPKLTCPPHGFVSTAAVGPDPDTGRATVYVAAGNGYLYALDAATGKTDWRSVVGRRLPSTRVNDIYNWASPAVHDGRVYMGVSSNCDNPWVRGGVQSFDAETGSLEHVYWGVPPHQTGGGVWTSPAVDSVTGDVYVTIGSGPDVGPQGDNYSVVRLAGSTLAKDSVWTVPPEDRLGDPDFASSPTLFHATVGGTDTDLVAACNKNGTLYAWKRANLAAGPVWTLQVGDGFARGQRACLAAPVWNGTSLFVGGNPGTLKNGVAYRGSLRKIDPSSGVPVWETGVGGVVLGTPSLSAGGVIAAIEYKGEPGTTRGVPLVDAGNGDQVGFLPGLSGFAQPVLVGGGLLVATDDGKLSYFAPRTTGDLDPPAPPDMNGMRSTDQLSADLTWDAVSDADSYRVFRNGGLLATLPGSSTTFHDTGLTADRAYSYFVQAVDGAGNSSRQSPTRVLPGD